MPVIEGMANIVTVCLGRNIRFNLVIQAISQLKKLYGDDYKTILGNCSNKFYIFTNEVETAEEFWKLLGDKTIVTYSRSGEIFDMTKHQTESVDARKILTVDELMHLEEGERRDLNGNKIRPYPIFNTADHTLKYRYEYLGEFFDNTKNLINEKVETLHSDVNLEDLLLYRNIKNKEPLVQSMVREKGIEDAKISKNEKLKDILVNEILTIDEVSDINKKIEMTVDEEVTLEVDFNMRWSEVKEILNEYYNDYDIEDLKKYIDKGELRLKSNIVGWLSIGDIRKINAE